MAHGRKASRTSRKETELEAWRGDAVLLEPDVDRDLLENVVSLIPILRIVTAIGQKARRRGVRYPVKSVDSLIEWIGDESLEWGNHKVNRDTIAHTMPASWFPIAHEGELLSRVHLALLRCEFEAAQAAPRPTFLAGSGTKARSKRSRRQR